MTHRVPLLWRFHLAHHIDRDLDVSTALRFYFGELIAGDSAAGGSGHLHQGVRENSIWQATFLLSIMFHHSSIRLPVHWERRLSSFL